MSASNLVGRAGTAVVIALACSAIVSPATGAMERGERGMKSQERVDPVSPFEARAQQGPQQLGFTCTSTNEIQEGSRRYEPKPGGKEKCGGGLAVRNKNKVLVAQRKKITPSPAAKYGPIPNASSVYILGPIPSKRRRIHISTAEIVVVSAKIKRKGKLTRSLTKGDQDAVWESDYRAAQEAYAKNDFSQAIGSFTKVIKSGKISDSDLSQVMADRGLVYRAKEQYVLAIDDYDKAISLNPKNNRAYYYRCNANLYHNQQFDRALSDCNKAIELVPNDPDPLGQRAFVNQKMGRKVEAIADYRQALNYQLKEDFLESRDSQESQAYRSALKELGAKP